VKRIAVVEDNPDNRLLLQALLEDAYELTEYETGRAALDGLAREKPDLVLLDISLPEMDGTEVHQHIRASATLRDLPVIALTAHAMAGDREKFLGAGFDDYVTKPIVNETILLRAIERCLTAKNRLVLTGGHAHASFDQSEG
jgi:CheY-like chemotaxis protein